MHYFQFNTQSKLSIGKTLVWQLGGLGHIYLCSSILVRLKKQNKTKKTFLFLGLTFLIFKRKRQTRWFFSDLEFHGSLDPPFGNIIKSNAVQVGNKSNIEVSHIE